jgi:hypothetical protein
VGHGILNEMALAALPGHPGEDGLPSGLEPGGGPARLRGGDIQAAEFLDDGRDLPGADALVVHLGDCEGHRPFAADTPLERLGIERPSILVPILPGLRDSQGDLANAGLEGLGFESVGVALMISSSLVRLGLQRLLALDDLQKECCATPEWRAVWHRRPGGLRHGPARLLGPWMAEQP